VPAWSRAGHQQEIDPIENEMSLGSVAGAWADWAVKGFGRIPNFGVAGIVLKHSTSGACRYHVRTGIVHNMTLLLKEYSPSWSCGPPTVTSFSGFQSPIPKVLETIRVPGFKS
jgi:hypothetical protein